MPVANQLLTFSPTVDLHCFNVMILDDAVLEDSEDFSLKLDTDDSMVILAPDMVEVRITDTDSKIFLVYTIGTKIRVL